MQNVPRTLELPEAGIESQQFRRKQASLCTDMQGMALQICLCHQALYNHSCSDNLASPAVGSSLQVTSPCSYHRETLTSPWPLELSIHAVVFDKSTDTPWLQGPGKKWEHYELNQNKNVVRIPMHVKKGDTVQVIAGYEKGQVGEVKEVSDESSIS